MKVRKHARNVLCKVDSHRRIKKRTPLEILCLRSLVD
jgi:hypothetical protein